MSRKKPEIGDLVLFYGNGYMPALDYEDIGIVIDTEDSVETLDCILIGRFLVSWSRFGEAMWMTSGEIEVISKASSLWDGDEVDV